MSTWGLVPFLAVKRETAMIAAFVGVGASGVMVSIGAWILLVRERRAARRDRND
jgi:hypothetical protein